MRSAYATLVDFDTGAVVGNYSSAKNAHVPKFAGTWTYRNDEGDHAESGSAYSVVTGSFLVLQAHSKQAKSSQDKGHVMCATITY